MRVELTVWRRLDNRLEGLPDNSPRAVELHVRRARALHDTFDKDPAWQVTNWDNTDTPEAHEWVLLALTWLAPAVKAAALPVAVYIGGRLLEAATDAAVVEPLKDLFSRLFRLQHKKQLQNFEVRLPNGAVVETTYEGTSVTVTLKDGTHFTVSTNGKGEVVPGETAS